MKFTYQPRGVCARMFEFDVQDGIVQELKVMGGCNGNLKGISALVRGMKVEDVIERLKGTTCGGKSTSCPDQIARALEQI